MAQEEESFCLGEGLGGQLFSVGEVCSRLSITRKTLFYYDQIGLLKPTKRVGLQNRKLYDEEKVRRLERIITYREAGLKIDEIRRLLDDGSQERLQILKGALARILEEKEDTNEKIRKLENLIRQEEVN